MLDPAAQFDPEVARVGAAQTGAAFVWDLERRRYRFARTGRLVLSRRVREAVDVVIRWGDWRVESATRMLLDGRLSLAEWQAAMARQIKLLHTAQAVAARGGWGSLTQTDWGYISGVLDTQLRYLERFALQIEAGEQPLTTGIISRAMQYARMSRATYEWLTGVTAREAGQDVEWNILGEADHCDDCLEQSARGPVPVGSLVPVGARQCLANCACELAYGRREAGGRIIEWGEDAAA